MESNQEIQIKRSALKAGVWFGGLMAVINIGPSIASGSLVVIERRIFSTIPIMFIVCLFVGAGIAKLWWSVTKKGTSEKMIGISLVAIIYTIIIIIAIANVM